MKHRENINILYEDEHIIVCVKPPGVATQTGRAAAQDMVSMLKNYRVSKKEDSYIGVVHRLDQPVEGILVLAKNQKAAGALSRQISQGAMYKEYLTVTVGEMAQDFGKLVDYLKKDGRTNLSTVVQKGTKDAKEARLQYHVLGRRTGEDGAPLNLVRIHLETGRHHQIRVQMSHAGYPILGDRKYGKKDGHKQDAGDKTDYMPLALCSAGLTFAHPVTGKKMEFHEVPSGRAFEKFSSG